LPTRLIFITGTDTGVGKTLLTALLLSHLRQSGVRTLALKPFCSGNRADAKLLRALGDGELTLDEINPFYFPEPLAPLVAARNQRRPISLQDAIDPIRAVADKMRGMSRSTLDAPHSTLLVEGSGGLLTPLGEGFSVLDLIARLHCETLVVSRNELGTINHTLLTTRALHSAFRTLAAPKPREGGPHSALKVVLMEPRRRDFSAASNPRILAELLAPVPLFFLPFLGPHCRTAPAIRTAAAKLRQTLAFLLGGQSKR
jgi:dethiobiotin synthetase